ncbi:hypothetical protein [Streptomyces sirii]|uniref:hypothetical protein n=1 Tax=Streptomyces sirii TaxID=3127701 RepID=UPI003D368F52
MLGQVQGCHGPLRLDDGDGRRQGQARDLRDGQGDARQDLPGLVQDVGKHHLVQEDLVYLARGIGGGAEGIEAEQARLRGCGLDLDGHRDVFHHRIPVPGVDLHVNQVQPHLEGAPIQRVAQGGDVLGQLALGHPARGRPLGEAGP